jgi:tryptophan 2,3-dioxygenase
MNTEEQEEKMVGLLMETAKHYHEANRAEGVNQYGNIACKYHDTNTGNQCAVGRIALNAESLEKSFQNTAADDEKILSNVRWKDEYKWIDELLEWKRRRLLCTLQELHDSRLNWTQHGLSEVGKESVGYMKQTIVDIAQFEKEEDYEDNL